MTNCKYFKVQILFFCFLSSGVFAQNLIDFGGSSVANNSSPSVAKISKSGTQNVNVFDGTFGYSTELGNVKHTNGLSYDLSLSYSSVTPLSTSMDLISGLPYGQGWNINVPSISISSAPYSKFNQYIRGERAYKSGTTPNTYLQFHIDLNRNCESEEIREEGMIYYDNISVNLPGIYNGQLIYGEKISDTEFLFYPSSFTNYFEAHLFIRPDGNNNIDDATWSIFLDDGRYFEFNNHVTGSEVAGSGQRMPTANRIDCIEINGDHQFRSKYQINTWYCSKIRSKNSDPDFGIDFLYDKFKSKNDLNRYTDIKRNFTNLIRLKEIKSDIESLVLEYEEVTDFENNVPLYGITGLDIEPTLDGLYGEIEVMNMDKNKWLLFLHGQSSHISNCLPDVYPAISKLNPYKRLRFVDDWPHGLNPRGFNYLDVSSNLNRKFGYQEGNEGKAYSHGFLESSATDESFTTGSALSLIPNDIYKFDFKVKGAPLCNFDVNIVTGSNPCGSEYMRTNYDRVDIGNKLEYTYHTNSDYYLNSRSLKLFSTFSYPMKYFGWYDGLGGNTSVGFRLPNIGNGLLSKMKIQIGPSATDLEYNRPNVAVPPTTPTPEICKKYYYENYINPEGTRSSGGNSALDATDPVPMNFGTGHPLYVQQKYPNLYNGHIGDIFGTPDGCDLDSWNTWNPRYHVAGGCPSVINYGTWPNEPTQLNLDKTELVEYALKRITRLPILLKHVKKYNIGREISAPYLVSHRSFAYSNYQVDNIAAYSKKTYDFQNINDTEINQLASGKRNFICLTGVVQEQVNHSNLYGTCSSNKLEFNYIEEEILSKVAYNLDPVLNYNATVLNPNQTIKMRVLNGVKEPNGKSYEITYKPFGLNGNNDSSYYTKNQAQIRRAFSRFDDVVENTTERSFCEFVRFAQTESMAISLFHVVDKVKTSDKYNSKEFQYSFTGFKNSTLNLFKGNHPEPFAEFGSSFQYKNKAGFGFCEVTGPIGSASNSKVMKYTHETTDWHLFGSTLKIEEKYSDGTRISAIDNIWKKKLHTNSGGVNGEHPDIDLGKDYYAIKYYPSRYRNTAETNKSYFKYLDNSITTTFYNHTETDKLIQKTEYCYTNTCGETGSGSFGDYLLRKSKTFNYNNQNTKSTIYYYPLDKGIDNLISRNMYNVPLEIHNFQGPSWAGGWKYVYTSSGSSTLEIVVKDEFELIINANHLVLRKSFSDFNSIARPQEAKIKNQTFNLDWESFGALKSKGIGERLEEMTYDVNSRLLISKMSELDQRTDFKYDCFRRLSGVYSRAENQSSQNPEFNLKTNYEYKLAVNNNGDNTIRIINYASDAQIPTILQFLDCEGRKRKQWDFQASPGGGVLVRSWRYNNFDLLEYEKIPEEGVGKTYTYDDPSGRLMSTYRNHSDFTAFSTNYDYGPQNITASSSSQYRYNGPLLRVVTTDPNGVKSAEYSDAFGRKHRQVADYGGLEARTEYVYNRRDFTKEIVTPDNNLYTYAYAYSNGWRTTKTIPGKEGSIINREDKHGRLNYTEDANGVKTSYFYNLYNQVRQINLDGVRAIKNTYYIKSDGRGRFGNMKSKLVGEVFDNGICNLTNSNCTYRTEYDYDIFGRNITNVESVGELSMERQVTEMDHRDLVKNHYESYTKQGKNILLNYSDGYNNNCGLHESQSFEVDGIDISAGNSVNWISKNYYNTKRLKNKFFNPNGTEFLERMNFSYNPVNWLKEINGGPEFCNPGGGSSESRSMANFANEYGNAESRNITVFYNQDDLIQFNSSKIEIEIEESVVSNEKRQALSKNKKEELYGLPSAKGAPSNSFSFSYNGSVFPEHLFEVIHKLVKKAIPSKGKFDPMELSAQISEMLKDDMDGNQENVPLCDYEVFRERIYYFDKDDHLIADFHQPQYNGNISATSWQVGNEEKSSAYNHHYDGLYRLTNSRYNQRSIDEYHNVGAYDAFHDYHDLEGNFKNVRRFGINPINNNIQIIDDLVYTMGNIPHRLASVLETAIPGSDLGYNRGNANFDYDKEGNIIKYGDMEITYNVINKPISIKENGEMTIRTFADGRVLEKKLESDVANHTRIYFGKMVYNDEFSLAYPQYINLENGRLVGNDGGEYYHKEYFMDDHLGNVRAVFTDKDNDGKIDKDLKAEIPEITGYHHYYPFGMEAVSYSEPEVPFMYKYNGKEEDAMTKMLDYGARWYEPSIGRWMGVDPLTEQFAGWTPYHYVHNNPVRLIDPTGLSAEKYDWQPDGNGNIIAEAGDDAFTLADYLGVSIEEAINMFSDFSNWDGGNNADGISDVEGHSLNTGGGDSPSLSSLSTPVSLAGAAAAGTSEFNVSGGKFRGASGSYYSIAERKGWNQYTGTKANMNARISGAQTAARVSKGLGAVNAGISTNQWLNGDLNNTAFGIELGSTGISTFAAPIVSIPWTIGYEVLGRQVVTRIPAYQNFKWSRVPGGRDGLISTPK